MTAAVQRLRELYAPLTGAYMGTTSIIKRPFVQKTLWTRTQVSVFQCSRTVTYEDPNTEGYPDASPVLDNFERSLAYSVAYAPVNVIISSSSYKMVKEKGKDVHRKRNN